MFDRFFAGFQPRLVPTLLSLPGVVILFGLAGWQFSRHIEREAENDFRAGRLALAAVDVDAAMADPAAHRFRRVTVEGTFAHDKELYVYARSLRGNEGFYVVTPLLREGKPAVLVNRGWVSKDLRSASLRAEGQLAGAQRIEGILRDEPRRGPWMPDNEIASNQWFWFDLPAMQKVASLPAMLPVYVEADLEPRNPGGWPRGGQTQIQLPRPHLQYAFTWFCLAIALAAVYLLSQRRKP